MRSRVVLAIVGLTLMVISLGVWLGAYFVIRAIERITDLIKRTH